MVKLYELRVRTSAEVYRSWSWEDWLVFRGCGDAVGDKPKTKVKYTHTHDMQLHKV